MFELEWTDEAKAAYRLLKTSPSQKARYKAVKKTLGYLAENPHHNSLQTHPYFSLKGPNGEKIFEAYARQKTPAAYRVFWRYGPDEIDKEGTRIPAITILAIIPHP